MAAASYPQFQITRRGKMANVTVTFNPNGKIKFSFAPNPVPVNPGKETIKWTRAGANFTFAALAFDHPNPFSNIIVHDKEITADDVNNATEDHVYFVLVNANGTYYNSKDDPTIHTGGATIRNN
jgi:hypothetical protein